MWAQSIFFPSPKPKGKTDADEPRESHSCSSFLVQTVQVNIPIHYMTHSRKVVHPFPSLSRSCPHFTTLLQMLLEKHVWCENTEDDSIMLYLCNLFRTYEGGGERGRVRSKHMLGFVHRGLRNKARGLQKKVVQNVVAICGAYRRTLKTNGKWKILRMWHSFQ